MKAYKIELLVIDFDGLGEEGIKTELENTEFANHCMSPQLKSIKGVDIGDWHDKHPLNLISACEQEYHRLFRYDDRINDN